MNKVLLSIFLSLNITSTICFGQKKDSAFVENNYWKNIIHDAQTMQRNIFVEFYASWCTSCKRMETEVLKNDSVSSYLKSNFITLRAQIDSTQSDNEEIKRLSALAHQLADSYKIRSVPAFLFFDSQSNLIHRAQGFYNASDFLDICKTVNSNNNFASMTAKYNNGELRGSSLLQYALNLKEFRDDSLALEVAQKYKDKYVLIKPNAICISPETSIFLDNFLSLFSLNDPFIKYIATHKAETDSMVGKEKYTSWIIDRLLTRDIINPELTKNRLAHTDKVRWNRIKSQIAKHSNRQTAISLILSAQIKWYKERKDWEKVIKYQIKKIDNIDTAWGFWDTFEINNFVYDIVLRHSNNKEVLNKACRYMESITNTQPTDHEALDTYANILFKSGHKERALLVERKALKLAKDEKRNDVAEIYQNTILKIEKNIPTWISRD